MEKKKAIAMIMTIMVRMRARGKRRRNTLTLTKADDSFKREVFSNKSVGRCNNSRGGRVSESTHGTRKELKSICDDSKKHNYISTNPVRDVDEDSPCELDEIVLPCNPSSNWKSHMRAMVISDDESEQDGKMQCFIQPKERITFAEQPAEDKLSTPMDQATKVQANHSAAYPSFVKTMLPSHVSGGFWLGLPSKFCDVNLPKQDCIIVLVDEAGKDFKTNYLAHKSGLSGGWRGFSIHQALQKGDVLVLHTEDSSPICSSSPSNSDIDQPEVLDGIRFSDSDINFKAIKDFNDFNTIVDGLFSYRDHFRDSKHRCAIRACDSFTSIKDLQTWKTTLDFLCNRLNQILHNASELSRLNASNMSETCTVELGSANRRMKGLEDKLAELKGVMENIDSEIEAEMAASVHKYIAKIRQIGNFPW
ncbi:hypothetical protein KSS87_006904 [Heliosperma pusillum]|nr:hypothetical protein KSS87_006904 [Heliosperma pusillum]